MSDRGMANPPGMRVGHSRVRVGVSMALPVLTFDIATDKPDATNGAHTTAPSPDRSDAACPSARFPTCSASSDRCPPRSRIVPRVHAALEIFSRRRRT